MDFTQRYKQFLEPDWSKVERLMRDSLRSDIDLLNRANDHILAHNGKMLRPALCLLVALACAGSVSEEGCRVAAASELLHNATLLHDDVADGSDERRGVPTTSSLLGNDASVLLGDYWLVRAMDQILSCGTESERLIRIFATTLSDLAEGEMLQLQKAQEGDMSREDYFRIIHAKTASLFEASCVGAAICAGASEAQIAAARDYGSRLGIAFQIKDDILDYAASDALGKPVGVDLREQKITLPLLGALERVDLEHQAQIRRMVCQMDDHPEYCDQIRAFVFEQEGIPYAERVLDEYVAQAKEALRIFPQGEAVRLLSDLSDFIAARDV